MTRKELATLIKEIEEAEKRLEAIKKDKSRVLEEIEENPNCKYWFNTTKLDSIFYPDELMALYNNTEEKLTKFLEVNRTILDEILDKVVI